MMGHLYGFGGVEFAWVFVMWLAMMVAMMLPPVLPWIWVFAAASKGQPHKAPAWGRTLIFASGYFALWSLYSLAAAGAQVALAHLALLEPATLRVGTVVGGVLLVVAGVVQFTPLKSACLKHCRSPLGYFLTRWEDGPTGAFSMGFRHGVFCLGCCWALMALSFALGTMNLFWMAVVTLLLCIEKIAPGGEMWSRAFGVGFVAWGGWVLLA
jgi:predicted metal-binding membrane protein